MLAIGGIGECPSASAALQDEIQVYLDDLNRPGEIGLELHVNTTPNGRTTPEYDGEIVSNHGVRTTPEFSYGLARDWEAGLYLPIASDASGHIYAPGAKLRMKWVGLHADGPTGGLFAGANVELSRVDRQFEASEYGAELRIMLGRRGEEWLVAVNPVFDWSLGGSQRSGTPDFNFGVKVARKVAEGVSVGSEYYGDVGTINDHPAFTGQDHRLYAAMDVDRAPWVFNFAVGYGLTAAADKWTIKLIVEIPL